VLERLTLKASKKLPNMDAFDDLRLVSNVAADATEIRCFDDPLIGEASILLRSAGTPTLLNPSFGAAAFDFHDGFNRLFVVFGAGLDFLLTVFRLAFRFGLGASSTTKSSALGPESSNLQQCVLQISQNSTPIFNINIHAYIATKSRPELLATGLSVDLADFAVLFALRVGCLVLLLGAGFCAAFAEVSSLPVMSSSRANWKSSSSLPTANAEWSPSSSSWPTANAEFLLWCLDWTLELFALSAATTFDFEAFRGACFVFFRVDFFTEVVAGSSLRDAVNRFSRAKILLSKLCRRT